jgi:hypothetical protein
MFQAGETVFIASSRWEDIKLTCNTKKTSRKLTTYALRIA